MLEMVIYVHFDGEKEILTQYSDRKNIINTIINIAVYKWIPGWSHAAARGEF